MKKIFEATALLVGTIIGAGIFGIPYVIARAGFWTGMITLIILGIAVMILYLYLGEVTLRTKGNHQLSGYAEKYLGKTGRNLMSIFMIIGIYGAMIAYILGIGQSLNAVFGGSALIYSIIAFAFFAFAIYHGVKTVAKIEFWILPGVLAVVVLFIIFSIHKIDFLNIQGFDIYSIFIPYGVILFSLIGAAAIPEMRQHLRRNPKSFKKAVIFGTLIPIVVYAIFALIVVGVTGFSTTEIATIGLGRALGEHMVIIGNLFAVFTMATSFLTLGLAGKQMYDYDYKLNHLLAWFLAMFVPLVIALSGFTTFIKAIGISGTISGGGEGILIVLMHWRCKKLGNRKPEYSLKKNYIIYFLIIAFFILGGVWFVHSLF